MLGQAQTTVDIGQRVTVIPFIPPPLPDSSAASLFEPTRLPKRRKDND
jgi:hypothetical protein